jgi:ADP-heptose:LPS heptosyltransferase
VRRVLVIKLGALGDMVLAFAALRRIRLAHPEAELTVLTTPPFATLAAACPDVDRVEDDGRPRGLAAAARMIGRLRRAGYDRIYDLQTSSRSSAYFQLLRPDPPEWSGVAPGCSHPHRNPDRDRMHTLERQADQLKDAGIWPDAPTAPEAAPPPDLSWMLHLDRPDLRPGWFDLEPPYALLIPGGSAHRLEKRWPAGRYARLARLLRESHLHVAVVGGAAEAEAAREILEACPSAKDLTGKTDFPQLAALGAQAALAVGNDTGPTHLIAAAGAPTLALFSGASDPALTAPRGPRVAVTQAKSLEDLPLEVVADEAFRIAGGALIA